MEKILYVLLPIMAIIIWMGYHLFEDHFLSKKMDIQSRMKAEARKPHHEEDHNRRLTQTEKSDFLWDDNFDEGIQKKIKNRAESKR